jgi:galactokinase
MQTHVAPHSPTELASPLLHRVLSLPELAPHIWGGKGVGSQVTLLSM